MPKIIGRESEEEILEEAYQSNRAELIALYGRRRVGKTYLTRNFFEKKKDTQLFFITGAKDGSVAEQAQTFSEQFTTFSFPGARLEIQKNWRDAFKALTHNLELCKKKKIVIFFDEFPWMATRGSRLLRIFETYWNLFWSNDPRIKLIICGSASSWILKNIINNRAGLYNRVTYPIHLEPFDLRQTKLYLNHIKVNLNYRDITDLYMAIGGIPFYLSKVKPGLSATQNIEQLAFKKNSFLLQEFNNLYSTLFNSGEAHIELARIITESAYGVGQEELVRKTSKLSSGGRIISYLDDLEQAGIIIRITPFGHKKRGIYYKMVDEYSLFYFRWIEPIKKSLLHQGIKKGYWQRMQSSPSWYSWAGYTFESVCLKHHLQISETLNLSPTAIPYSWRFVPAMGSKDKGAQIDLLFDRDDNAITICEIKYTQNPFVFDKSYAQKINQKIEIFQKRTGTSKNIFMAFVSAAGLKKSLYFDEFAADNSIVVLKDLFKKVDTW